MTTIVISLNQLGLINKYQLSNPTVAPNYFKLVVSPKRVYTMGVTGTNLL